MNLTKLAMYLIIIFLANVFTIGCGKDSGSSSSPPPPTKELKSVWESETLELDLTVVEYFTQITMNFFADDNAHCECFLTMDGDGLSGDFLLTTCGYKGGGAGDPGCGDLSQQGTYVNSAATLTICSTNLLGPPVYSCEIYK